MIRELRPFLRALLAGQLKRVSLTIVRKREGIHVGALAFTGSHVFACASYAHAHHPNEKKVSVADIVVTGQRRLTGLWSMVGLKRPG